MQLTSRLHSAEAQLQIILSSHFPAVRDRLVNIEAALTAKATAEADNIGAKLSTFVDDRVAAIEKWAQGLPLPDHAKFVPPVLSEPSADPSKPTA